MFLNSEVKIINPILQSDIDYIINIISNNKIQNECDLIGSGQSGSVYLYKEFAIKVFNYENEDIDMADPYYLERLQGYEGFPTLFFYVNERFMVTEYVEGCIITELPYNQIVPLPEFTHILESHIQYADSKGLMVTDLHAENIILTPYGYPVLIDVGSYRDLNMVDDHLYNHYRSKLHNQLKDIQQIENDAIEKRLQIHT